MEGLWNKFVSLSLSLALSVCLSASVSVSLEVNKAYSLSCYLESILIRSLSENLHLHSNLWRLQNPDTVYRNILPYINDVFFFFVENMFIKHPSFVTIETRRGRPSTCVWAICLLNYTVKGRVLADYLWHGQWFAGKCKVLLIQMAKQTNLKGKDRLEATTKQQLQVINKRIRLNKRAPR